MFGGITGSPWAHSAHYFGAVQSMVFRLTPTLAASRAAAASAPAVPSASSVADEGSAPLHNAAPPAAQRSQSNKKQRVAQHQHGDFTCTAYRWAGGNRYFQSVSCTDASSSLAMGGGGAFAWSLDEELLHGSSGPCDTFASPQLSAAAQFHCAKLEVWALQPAQAQDALVAAASSGLGGASATAHAD